MTTTELLPALLFESLPKPSPYPFDEPPSAPVNSRQSHPRLEMTVRIPHYPGMAYQAPTPGYPPDLRGAQRKPERREERHRPTRHPQRPRPEPRGPHPSAWTATDPHPPSAQPPSAIHRTGSLAGLTGHQIRDLLIHAATPPEPVSLINPTGEFAKKVDAVARARQTEEAIPKQHLPQRRLTFRLWRLLPVLLLIATCRHCGRPWPCHRLRRHLTARHGTDIDLPILRLSTRRRRKRADRRSPTAITHRPKPRRIDKQEQQLGHT